MSLSKPKITDVKVCSCTDDVCGFYIYFDSPPVGVGIELSAYVAGCGDWHFLAISDPEVLADNVWRVFAETSLGDTHVKIMFRTTDEFKPIEQRQSDPWSFKCLAESAPPAPAIDHVDVYFCDGSKCQLHVYFDSPPEGVAVLLYFNDVFIATSPVASGDLYRVAAECTEGETFTVQLCFQSQDARTWSKRVGCDGALGKCSEEVRNIAPNIRDIDVYFCDGNECHFHVYFDPPPDGAEVEVYMDDIKIPAEIEISAGFPRAVLQHMQGESVTVQLAFVTGVFRTYGAKVLCSCVLFGGLATDLDGVASSNVGAVGWHRWLESYNPGSPYYVNRNWHPVLPWPIKEDGASLSLDTAMVRELFKHEEMSEDEARLRFAKMGYRPDDVDYLIILSSPP